jgi:hypothetical protein
VKAIVSLLAPRGKAFPDRLFRQPVVGDHHGSLFDGAEAGPAVEAVGPEMRALFESPKPFRDFVDLGGVRS